MNSNICRARRLRGGDSDKSSQQEMFLEESSTEFIPFDIVHASESASAASGGVSRVSFILTFASLCLYVSYCSLDSLFSALAHAMNHSLNLSVSMLYSSVPHLTLCLLSPSVYLKTH